MTKRPPKQPTPILADRIRRIVESTSLAGQIRPATSVLNTRSSRLPSFKTAKLVFPTGEAIDVVVKNFSQTGARVEFVRNVDLPEQVLLRQGAATFA